MQCKKTQIFEKRKIFDIVFYNIYAVQHGILFPETWKHRAIEIWQDKIFELLLNENKIVQETVAGMRTWRHSGFSVDNSVRIEAKNPAAMQRWVEYTVRCPFSLTRIIWLTDDGKILQKVLWAISSSLLARYFFLMCFSNS